VLTGRCATQAGTITVTGDLPDGTTWQTTLAGTPTEHRGLRAIWARAHVRDLEDRYVTAQAEARRTLPELERHIVAVSLEFGVLCRFTAFVAVDQNVVNAGGQVHRVTQPVERPQGWQLPTPAPRMVPMVASAGAVPPHGPMAAELASAKFMPASSESSPIEASTVHVTDVPILSIYAGHALTRLRDATTLSFAQRVQILTDLAAELTRWLDRFADMQPETAVTQLRELAKTMSQPPTTDAALDTVWQSATDLFQSLSDNTPSQPSRPRTRPFWKR
jgi:Ca-activated chloride channel family protein